MTSSIEEKDRFSILRSNFFLSHYQDYTTIFVEDEKIEGFFPRVTQLVSVVMLLVFKDSRAQRLCFGDKHR